MGVGLNLRLPRREGSKISILPTPADLQGQRIKALPLNFLHFDPSLSVALPHLPNHSVPGFFFVFVFVLLCLTACGILVSQLGLEFIPPALEVWSLNHWTTREVPVCQAFNTMPLVAHPSWSQGIRLGPSPHPPNIILIFFL